jgi:hypothetical protein
MAKEVPAATGNRATIREKATPVFLMMFSSL